MKARILFTTLCLLLSGCLTTLPTVAVPESAEVTTVSAYYPTAFERHNYEPHPVLHLEADHMQERQP